MSTLRNNHSTASQQTNQHKQVVSSETIKHSYQSCQTNALINALMH